MRASRFLTRNNNVWTAERLARHCCCRPFSSSTSEASQNSNTVVVEEYKSSNKNNNAHAETDNNNRAKRNFGKILNNPNHADDTALVDKLLAFARDLMDSTDNSVVADNEKVHVRHVVAFSGGIDSSLVLALLAKASQDETTLGSHNNSNNRESVHAVMGRSPAVPQDQVALARHVAAHVGIPLQEVSTDEGNDQIYVENNGQACLACKTHLYSALQAVAEHAASEDALLFENNNNNINSNTPSHQQAPEEYRHQLYNGTNADDVQDSTRVGLIAAQNFRVQSPLLHTTKSDVRRAAQHLGLPNWNVAASPCLRSRLALGVEATQEHLERIEAAERFVRFQLRDVLLETANLRVRLLAGNRAMLEIDSELLQHVQSHLSSNSSPSSPKGERVSTDQDWEDYFVQRLGFASVDTRAFRSGSVSKNEYSSNSSQPQQPKAMDGLREAVA